MLCTYFSTHWGFFPLYTAQNGSSRPDHGRCYRKDLKAKFNKFNASNSGFGIKNIRIELKKRLIGGTGSAIIFLIMTKINTFHFYL